MVFVYIMGKVAHFPLRPVVPSAPDEYSQRIKRYPLTRYGRKREQERVTRTSVLYNP